MAGLGYHPERSWMISSLRVISLFFGQRNFHEFIYLIIYPNSGRFVYTTPARFVPVVNDKRGGGVTL